MASIQKRIALGFIVAAISVLTFHQAMWELLHYLALPGLGMPPPFPTEAVPPFGVPRIASLCFWGGVWGAAFGAVWRGPRASLWWAGLLLGVVAALTGLFVDPRGETPLTKLYKEFTGDTQTFEEHAMNARRLIMRASLPSEVHTLSRALEALAEQGKRPHDFTNAGLSLAISETVAAFPVYRTYLRADGSSARARPRRRPTSSSPRRSGAAWTRARQLP